MTYTCFGRLQTCHRATGQHLTSPSQDCEDISVAYIAMCVCVCVWLPFINASHQNLARVLATHAFAYAHRFHPPVGAIIYYREANIKDCGKDGEREGSPLAKSALRNQLVQANGQPKRVAVSLPWVLQPNPHPTQLLPVSFPDDCKGKALSYSTMHHQQKSWKRLQTECWFIHSASSHQEASMKLQTLGNCTTRESVSCV